MSDSFFTITTCTVIAPPRPKSALLGRWPDCEMIDEVILRVSASTFSPRAEITPCRIFALFSWFVMPTAMPTPTACRARFRRGAGISGTIGRL